MHDFSSVAVYYKTEKKPDDIPDLLTLFCCSQPTLATASLSGALGIWDLNSHRLKQQCKHPVSQVFYCFCGLTGLLVQWVAKHL